MNFLYDGKQFDRLTKLVEFNTLLCIDIITKELEDIVKRKKQFTPKMRFTDVVKTMRRVSSFRGNRGATGADLKLKVSLEKEKQLRRYALASSGPDRQHSMDSSDSDYTDALEELPDEASTNLWAAVPQ